MLTTHKSGWTLYRKLVSVSYKERDKILKELGYDDYRGYLKSKLWTEIRDKILEESGYECICCGNQNLGETLVMQVHHMVYTKGNLSGESTYGLVAICRSCHAKAELKPRRKINGRKERFGKKKTLEEANAYVLGLKTKTKKKKKKKKKAKAEKTHSKVFYQIKTKCKICKIESDNRKEICTYCENQQESMSLKWLGGSE